MKKVCKIGFILTLLLFSITITINGQIVEHKKIEYTPNENLLKRGTSEFVSGAIEVPIHNPEPFLAFGLNATVSEKFDYDQFLMRSSADGENWSEWQLINYDDEAGKIDNKFLGRLLFLKKNTKFIEFKTSEYADIEKLTFSFISPGKTDESKITERINKSRLSKSIAGIERPEFVSRKSWGCPQDEHVNTRSLTDVTHLIIHHSAGNTVSNDYAAVVRSYWDYHVNGHGWSDIGYNWLVDPNGVLYKGRAWKSSSQENVVGAHNSGKNGNTAGICIIGNYVSAIPGEQGLNKVADISAFLSDKYGIDPVGQSYHSAIQAINDNMDGHGQSGGGTACPGTQVINRMQTIRDLTASKILDITAAPEVVHNYPNSEVDSAYLSKQIAVEFSHPMNQASVEAAFSLTPGAFGNTSWNSDGDILYFNPSPTLAKETNYNVKINKSAMSYWDIPLAEDIEFNFVTKSSDNLSLIDNFPQNDEIDVANDVTVMLQFDGPLNASSLAGNVLFLDDQGNEVQIKVITGGYAEGIIEFYPTNQLDENKTYSIVLKDGIATTDGYNFGKTENINFTTRSLTSVNDVDTPVSYNLISAYPNPFNPATTVEYQIKERSNVSIKVFDIIGNLVATLVNGNFYAGTYKVSFDAGHLPSGVYFSQILTDTDKRTIKLLLTK